MQKKSTVISRLQWTWQRMRDSNPRKRSQSPVCYRYTNPLYYTWWRQQDSNL